MHLPRQRRSEGDLRKPKPRKGWRTPTLQDLIDAEREQEDPSGGYFSQESLDKAWADSSAKLYPPLYGRPRPTPSPDVFATLISPLFSRPSSRASSPPPVDRSSSSIPAQFPPRTSSDPGPSVESQGFVLYTGSSLAYLAYLVWAFLPERWLERIGVGWYPSREWALLVPAWAIMLVVYVYVAYAALNAFITPSLDSIDSFTDYQAYVLSPRATATTDTADDMHPLIANSINLEPDAVPPLHDLPVSIVNDIVFGEYDSVAQDVSFSASSADEDDLLDALRRPRLQEQPSFSL